MRDHVVALGDDELVLVFQRVWRRADQVEQAVAAGRDVGAVLDIAIRPETLGGDIVALVKKTVSKASNTKVLFFSSIACVTSFSFDILQVPSCGQSIQFNRV
jgi:hypothetical protein